MGGSRQLCHQHTACDALALGKLIKGLKRTGLYPVPEVSSLRRSIKDLFSAVWAIELSPLCMEFTKNARKGYRSFDDDEVTYHLDEELRDSLSSIELMSRCFSRCLTICI
jgi:hypothetical protein